MMPSAFREFFCRNFRPRISLPSACNNKADPFYERILILIANIQPKKFINTKYLLEEFQISIMVEKVASSWRNQIAVEFFHNS